jgi:D-serine dehydratase
MIDLSEIRAGLVDGRTKGMPPGLGPSPLGALGRRGWNVLRDDLPLPLAVLKEPALAGNGAWMRAFLARTGALLAPHGKTTMAPQLFARQLEDGCWGITVATAQQLAVCRHFGFPRVLLANQLVGRPEIDFVCAELARDPAFDFYCLVDSIEGVRRLAERKPPRPIQVLLELGYSGGRTGARTRSAALEIAREAKSAGLALRGVEGFEGLLEVPSAAEQDARVAAFLDEIAATAKACAEEELFAPGPVLLSAGGSAFYDLVADRFRRAAVGRETQVVLRSGCYLSHDSGMYRRFFGRLRQRTPWAAEIEGGLAPALELWAAVQSRPEPGKAIVTLGKRDAGTDADLPVAERWFRPGLQEAPAPAPAGLRTLGLNDQHLHLAVPEECPLAVGDRLAFGVSHPCTSFDKWQVIPIVNERYDVIDAVRTYF